jgi:hypothetical protein
MQKFRRINFTITDMKRLLETLEKGVLKSKDDLEVSKLEIQGRQQLVDRIRAEIKKCLKGEDV